MTVKELKQELEKVPDDLEVLTNGVSGFNYSMLAIWELIKGYDYRKRIRFEHTRTEGGSIGMQGMIGEPKDYLVFV